MAEGSESVRLGRALEAWLGEAGFLSDSARADLERAWREAAGEGLAAQTRLVGLRREQLWVEVTSAPLRAELEGFRKAELLAGLRERYTRRHISDIRFVVSGSPR